MTSASKKLLKELPSDERMAEIMENLKSFGPQATAIMGAAYLEHALEKLLRTTLRPLPKKRDNDKLFDGAAGGALGSFSAKIKIAYATNLLDEKVYDALLLINDIRVTFAHSLHGTDFNHEFVKADCQRLGTLSGVISNAVGIFMVAHFDPAEIYVRIVRLLYHSIRYKADTINEPPAAPVP